MTFPDALARVSVQVRDHLRAAMADMGTLPVALAMRYACEGGKGIRGFLVVESARLHDLPVTAALDAAAAIEALHTYSLIHDDLPCMDDDDLRRGRPTVHRKWDEATAVLAGDALQALAFGLLSRPTGTSGDAQARLTLLHGLAHHAGICGMVRGQALDMAAETAPSPPGLDGIIEIQAHKTGALIVWSAEAGAVLAGRDPTAMRHYGTALGLAFQIADDILDVTGNADAAGKRLNKDADAGKATFVSLLGLDGARARARDLVAEAELALAGYGPAAQHLIDAARFVIARDR